MTTLRTPSRPGRQNLLASLAAVAVLGASAAAHAQSQYPITPQQRSVAQATAQTGIPLSELSPNAPDEYTVKRGDTLWDISRMFLRSPWRWPELWGMNLNDIKNPHLIYPGQVLYLERSNGRARLTTRAGGSGGTIKLTPRTRYDSVSDLALPTLRPSLIEAFLTEGIVIDNDTLAGAPRVVAGRDDRVLLSRGDRIYAAGGDATQLIEKPGPIQQFRIFRDATPMVDPGTGEVLGYEAQYLGRARLERSQTTETQLEEGKMVTSNVPATLDVVAAREEIRAGDRLLPEPPRQLINYVPHAPATPVEGGRIVSVYGNAVKYASQNQVVAINKGIADGIESGHVMAILKNGAVITDRSNGTKETLKLPNERIGLLMVFRTFQRVSYALVLEISDVPQAGDLLVNP
ncbi:LysM domain-containing protein [Variovorax dokdonensis]|uniref:LysM domain-containing protein n=1 Tax=Variovorax dokdonensis TaxID=344883 RepID=A0ABT7N9R1_9BURK|nr:LysM domain-containing protein [Variovorax dokdonensis]MDM0044685.1 LysM domain-containing protein [Variovorax dokdonensis]